MGVVGAMGDDKDMQAFKELQAKLDANVGLAQAVRVSAASRQSHELHCLETSDFAMPHGCT